MDYTNHGGLTTRLIRFHLAVDWAEATLNHPGSKKAPEHASEAEVHNLWSEWRQSPRDSELGTTAMLVLRCHNPKLALTPHLKATIIVKRRLDTKFAF